LQLLQGERRSALAARRNGMTETTGQLARTDPRHHTANIKGKLDDLISHLRSDIGEIDEPRAQVLFETTAEVLQGLKKAYEHYEQGEERAFRR
jgi:hypothetical protein